MGTNGGTDGTDWHSLCLYIYATGFDIKTYYITEWEIRAGAGREVNIEERVRKE